MEHQKRIEELLGKGTVQRNLPRADLIQACVDNKEAFVSKCGAMATWTSPMTV